MRLSIINYIINERSFNTASGKYIYSILFVFPSLRSGTRDVRTSSSLCSSAGTLRRIPQALSTVTTIEYSISVLQLLVSYNTASGKRCCNKICLKISYLQAWTSYNTASGKRCCNFPTICYIKDVLKNSYNTASGKRCCNLGTSGVPIASPALGYNTASGKRCCNVS